MPQGLDNVKTISAGGWHTGAILQDGTLVMWGYNEYGQCDVPAVSSDSASDTNVF